MNWKFLFLRSKVVLVLIIKFLIHVQVCENVPYPQCIEDCRYSEIDTTLLICSIDRPDNSSICECPNGCLRGVALQSSVKMVVVHADVSDFLISMDSFQGNWQQVTSLTIFSFSGPIIIYPKAAFASLASLRSLWLSTDTYGICPTSGDGYWLFQGLDNLVKLHLAGIKNCFDQIKVALGKPGVMPSLKTITLGLNEYGYSGVDTYHKQNFGWRFYAILSHGRNLTSLTLKRFHIQHLSLVGLHQLGSYVRTVEIQSCRIDNLYVGTDTISRNLETINFQDTAIKTWHFGQKVPISIHNPSLRILLLIERYGIVDCPKYSLLDLKHLNECPSFELCLKLYREMDSQCDLRLITIVRDENILRLVANWFIKHREIIDLSHMSISYISRNILAEGALDLSLSDNKLYIMQQNEPVEFRELFYMLSDLQAINLDNNQLTDLPFNLFLQNTRLHTLRLSSNRLTTFNINTERFNGLTFLDLRYNDIHTVDIRAQKIFEQLRFRINGSFDADLSRNPYVCSCDNQTMSSLKWMKVATYLLADKRRYVCTLDDLEYNIYQAGVDATEEYCSKKERIRLLTLILPPIGVVIIVTIIVILSVKRYVRRKRKFNAILNQIQDQKLPWRFLVFLSFCSENEQLVMNDIYPQLTNTIADKTKTNFDLVCFGDKDFVPGLPLCSQIINCINESAVFLAIVSEDYCSKNWCQIELQEAYSLRKPIIIVLIGYVEPQSMGTLLSKIFHRYAHASWIVNNGVGHLQPDWPDFVHAIIELASMIPTEDTDDIEMNVE